MPHCTNQRPYKSQISRFKGLLIGVGIDLPDAIVHLDQATFNLAENREEHEERSVTDAVKLCTTRKNSCKMTTWTEIRKSRPTTIISYVLQGEKMSILMHSLPITVKKFWAL